MSRITAVLTAGLFLIATAHAAPPKVEDVQGLYEGTLKDAKVEARLVATGKGTFKLLIRQPAGDGKTSKIALDGKFEGDEVKFTGQGASAAWANAAVTGNCGPDAPLALKRIVRESPTLGAKPPEGAIVLLDGKNFDEIVKKPLKDGAEQQWVAVDGGGILVPKGGFSSKRRFADSFKYHVEFKNPLMPEATGQGRGNSGVHLPCGTEIQVLDSFGMTTYTGGGCGGFYKYKDPDTFDEFSLASAPPLQWQTYDIEYRIEKKDGKPTGRPRITVFHNGIKIHDNFEVQRNAREGNLSWQDHNNPVHYRNIWIQVLPEK